MNDINMDEKERDRKRKVDAKFGKGTYERAKASIKPHRCAPELKSFFEDLVNFKGYDSFQKFISCAWSTPKK